MAEVPSSGERWTGGLKDMHLNCPVDVLWDFVADWAHWDRFYPSSPDFPMVSELREDENRKVGCLRYAEVAPGTWTTERLLALDNANHYFSYSMEDNVFCGGLRNYIAKVQAFTKFFGFFLSGKLVTGMEAASEKIAAERWTGGIQPTTFDCSLDVLWDLITDWGNWARFYPQDPGFTVKTRLVEGENRKLGCVRFAELAPGVSTNERLIAIDNDKHYLSYNMEENNLSGGLCNYVAKFQVSPTSDGKTKLEYWNFEVDPLTEMTREQFSAFMGNLLGTKLSKGLEATAQKLAASKPKTSTTTTNGHHHHLHLFGHKN